MRRIVATPDELRLLLESCYGGTATPLYVVPVRHIVGSLLWEGDIHVFNLTGQDPPEAYA